MYIVEDARAPNPRRVRIFLAEKEIEIEFRQIDINTLDHLSADFSRLNPMRRIPILVFESGRVLSESMAICRYFEELEPEPHLLGKDPFDKAWVEMWNRRMELNLLFPIAQAFRHQHPAMKVMEVPQISAWGKANAIKAIEVMEMMDEQLADHPFIAGKYYSVADITALVAIDFLKPARITRPEGLRHLNRWYKQVLARPSSKA